ncbi:MAG: hypothetical protein L0287_35990 [Anaerolineae bacterium]|nr:hypothetical protein [Anaerolineae bacterium]
MKKAHSTKKPGKKIGKKSTQKKYPLRGKPVIYRDPFEGVDYQSQNSSRVPGNDKGKVIIMPDFDEPLPEFDL